VHLIGFIIRIYHDARYSECQIENSLGSLGSFVAAELPYSFPGDWMCGRLSASVLDFPLDSHYSPKSLCSSLISSRSVRYPWPSRAYRVLSFSFKVWDFVPDSALVCW